MKKCISSCAIILSLLVTHPSHADEVTQFAMQSVPHDQLQKCELVQRYYRPDKPVEKFPGRRTDNSCEVTIDKNLFNNRFRLCFLSGIGLSRTSDAQAIECVTQKRKEDFIFIARLDGQLQRESQVMCYFTCINNGQANQHQNDID